MTATVLVLCSSETSPTAKPRVVTKAQGRRKVDLNLDLVGGFNPFENY